jgi:dienelactone hydrolase
MLDVSIVVGAFLLAASSMTRRAAALTRGLIVVVVGLCLAQVWREGFYWQFIPVVVLIALAMLSGTTAVVGRGVLRIAGRALTVLALLLLFACWIFLPVPVLPLPTGRFAVGTSVVRWTMPSRAELSTVTDSDHRSIIVQAWYPAAVTPEKLHAPYLDGLGNLPARVLGLPRAILQHYERIDTHANRDAAVNADVARWPVVIFSPGYGASRSFYTTLLGDLASRGVIVLAVDHPYEAAITQLADGRIVTHVERLVPNSPDRTDYMAQQTDVRTADLRAVLDDVGNVARFGPLADHMDRDRIIAAGHSFGGAASVALAETDTRVQAAVNIDGTLYGSIPDQSLLQPFLLIESDREETKHGQRFLDGHVRLMGHARGPTHRCQIARANHYSFTDAPLLLSSPWRWAVSLIVGGSRGVPETVKITNDLLLALQQGKATAGLCQQVLR